MIRRILYFLEQVTKVVIVAAIVVWVADWAVFRAEAARGRGFETVEVQEFLGTPLKGNKTEYDYMGPTQVKCARTLFPHGGAPACWWVRRHRTQWE